VIWVTKNINMFHAWMSQMSLWNLYHLLPQYVYHSILYRFIYFITQYKCRAVQ
jgi:hypothetical protein